MSIKSPNLSMKSNVWINMEYPAQSDEMADWSATKKKAREEIPGDLMIEFLAVENPGINPRSRFLIEQEMTKKQLQEYLDYHFFLPHGLEG